MQTCKVLQVANKGYSVIVGNKRLSNTKLLTLDRHLLLQVVLVAQNRSTGDYTVILNYPARSEQELKEQRDTLQPRYDGFIINHYLPGTL